MKTNIQATPVAESLAEVISLIERKNRFQQRTMENILAMCSEINEERTGLSQPLTTEQLKARFQAQSEGRRRSDLVLRADVRPGVIVGMTREQSARFDQGEFGQVIAFKKG